MRSRAEIRQVLIDFDSSTASRLFGKASVKVSGSCECTEGLGPDGSPITMQIEMEKEIQSSDGGVGGKRTGAKGKGAAKKNEGTGKKKGSGGTATKKR